MMVIPKAASAERVSTRATLVDESNPLVGSSARDNTRGVRVRVRVRGVVRLWVRPSASEHSSSRV